MEDQGDNWLAGLTWKTVCNVYRIISLLCFDTVDWVTGVSAAQCILTFLHLLFSAHVAWPVLSCIHAKFGPIQKNQKAVLKTWTIAVGHGVMTTGQCV